MLNFSDSVLMKSRNVMVSVGSRIRSSLKIEMHIHCDNKYKTRSNDSEVKLSSKHVKESNTSQAEQQCKRLQFVKRELIQLSMSLELCCWTPSIQRLITLDNKISVTKSTHTIAKDMGKKKPVLKMKTLNKFDVC